MTFFVVAMMMQRMQKQHLLTVHAAEDGDDDAAAIAETSMALVRQQTEGKTTGSIVASKAINFFLSLIKQIL